MNRFIQNKTYERGRVMFFHTHAHSEFSCLDGMASIPQMVAKASSFGQPGMAITEHGNMSGVFQLYKSCKKEGIIPFPGLEAYVVDDVLDKNSKRHHLTLLAYTTQGYKNLVALSSLSQRRDHYHYKPRLDLRDFNSMDTTGIACLTGCYFSDVCQAIVNAHDEDEGIEKATRIVTAFKNIFSPVFIEIQHHHTNHTQTDKWDDDKLVRALYKLALKTSTPPIVSNDCHYCDKGDKPLHDMMKMIAYSSDMSEVSFPGDSYHLASEAWMKKHYREHNDVWEDSQDSFKQLLDMNTLSIPVLDTYKYYVPAISTTPNEKLRKLCSVKMSSLKHLIKYTERLDYELDVVDKLGMADYFLLVHDYVSWCERKEIFVMARGSAAGSLICWLLGFTQVDPIKWNLTFDRFLTPDRIRPPDIDLDIEDTRREDVINYLKSRYDIMQIGTYNRLSFDEETGRGGLFVQYISAQRKILGVKFAQILGRVRSLHDLDMVRPHHARDLRSLGSVALRRSAGSHAAGFVVSAPPEHTIQEWIPTMLIASSDSTVTQMMMDDIEDAGYIKIDLLGLRSLSTVRRCLELINKKGLEWIPERDNETFKFLRKGIAETGVFQMEGYTAAKGCRQVKVKNINDLILVNALYRPATRNSGYVDMFLENRKDPSKVVYPHKVFRKHLQETYGVPCYQEQVLGILRDLGMPIVEMNDFLKAVKGKHSGAESADVFDENINRFNVLCKQAGMDSLQTDEAWSLVEGFAAYGFNRAHSTAYSLLGYQMAYLKVHHPLEFHAALLETSSGTAKEEQYIKETKRVGVSILGACVNRSLSLWSIDSSGKGIRRGLCSIKGVGTKAAESISANAPYNNIEELISICSSQSVTGGKKWSKEKTLTGVMYSLQQAGALRQIGVMPESRR